MYSPEVQSRMAHLRAKVVDGSITEAELAEAVKMVREDRFAVLQAQANKPASSRAKAKAPVNVADLFADLGKL